MESMISYEKPKIHSKKSSVIKREASRIGSRMESMITSNSNNELRERIRKIPEYSNRSTLTQSLSKPTNSDQIESLISLDSFDQKETEADFACYINKTSLIKYIKIDMKTNKTPSDIKNQIGHQFNLQSNQFFVDNKCKIKDNFIINLTILKPISNITFQFPNFSCTINDCYEKCYKDIIDQFNKQNIFFSQNLNELLEFKLWDIKIPKSDFYFNCIPEGACIYVEPKKYCFIKISRIQFQFC